MVGGGWRIPKIQCMLVDYLKDGTQVELVTSASGKQQLRIISTITLAPWAFQNHCVLHPEVAIHFWRRLALKMRKLWLWAVAKVGDNWFKLIQIASIEGQTLLGLWARSAREWRWGWPVTFCERPYNSNSVRQWQLAGLGMAWTLQ